jgi:hypothetical protein
MAASASGKGKKPAADQPSAPAKAQVAAKDAISLAAKELGGIEALVAWVRSDPKNQQVFWTSIYPKLMPLQAPPKAKGKAGIRRIERFIVRPSHPDR